MEFATSVTVGSTPSTGSRSPTTSGALQRNGFEVEKVVNLSQHYAKTTAAWYQRMIANEPLALSLLDRPTYRAWQLYLAGGSGSFLNKRSQVYRIYCEAV